MTSLLERTVAIIAPHRCIVCGNYNNVLCSSCSANLLHIETGFCVLCAAPSLGWRVCGACSPSSCLSGAFARWEYSGVIKNVIKQFKFEHARAACVPLASGIFTTLPYLGAGWIVVTVPTVSKHIRERGYDHALLLAREVARFKRLPLRRVLRRKRNVYQRGASRKVRLEQAQTTFEVVSPERISGYRVLVVDDVCTTGATLSAAAKVLKQAGATEVWGAVAAWKLRAK